MKKLCVGFVCVLVMSTFGQTYEQIQEAALKFYGYQRAGLASGNPHNPYYENRGLTQYPHAYDATGSNPLDGGWYDAGDFMKFGLPMGYAVYCLLKGYDVFPHGYGDKTSWSYGAANGVPDVLDEVKVGTDYLCKAVISDSRVVMDVGNPYTDHGSIYESGVDNSNRTRNDRLSSVRDADGADVPGLYAAALALMSRLYRPYDETYADACLVKARQAFACGIRNRTKGNSTPTGEFYAYPNPTWVDKLMAGAIELYKATNEATYRGWIDELKLELTIYHGALGYTSVSTLVSFELYRLGMDNTASLLVNNVNWCLNRVQTTPASLQGAFINVSWGTARDASTAAFAAGLAFLVTGNDGYRTFAENQTKWVIGTLGYSNQSYMTSIGANSPRNIHHRNALAYSSLLPGALVAGPDDLGNWQDNSQAYEYTEVALDYNAGIVGAMAFLRELTNPPAGQVQIVTPLSAAPDPVDFNTQTLTLSAGFHTSVPWSILLTGTLSGAEARVSGTGQSVSAVWTGEADKGTFLSGEMVHGVFEMDNIVSYHLSRKQTDFIIGKVKVQPFKATDVLIDTFNDSDSLNAIGGWWETFSDASEGGGSYTSPGTFSPLAITTQGESGTAAMRVRFVGRAGAVQPYAGVRTTLRADGAPVNIGSASSIVFDVKGNPGDTFRVELEQLNGTQINPFGKVVVLAGSEWARVRLQISDMTLPLWQSNSVALNTGAIRALRFTYYGLSNVAPTIDNVHIEGLAISNSDVVMVQQRLLGMQAYATVAGKDLVMQAPGGLNRPVSYSVLTLQGKAVAQGTLEAGVSARLRLDPIGSGTYLVVFFREGQSVRHPAISLTIRR